MISASPHGASTADADPDQPLLVSMGDPCGIGPEVVALQWMGPAWPRDALVVGDAAVMARALSWVAQHRPRAGGPSAVQAFASLAEAKACVARQAACPPGQAEPVLPVWSPPGLPQDLTALPLGQVHRDAGLAAAVCVRQGAQAVQAGQGRALVTAPLHKEALALAGEPFPGHTELLQSLVTAPGQPLVPVRMMLACPQLRTVLVSIHVSLRQALEAVRFDPVLQTIRITHVSLQRMGIAQPRVAVAGLNPHAGEGGLFGREEIEVIAPAVAQARAEGIDATGPWAPDTVFMRARHAPDHPGEFDVVVAMYHDQGLIPVKYLGVAEGVNVTLGLPFVRTSPDHGTAFDIAGTLRADPASLTQAMTVARQLTPRWPSGRPA